MASSDSVMSIGVPKMVVVLTRGVFAALEYVGVRRSALTAVA